MSTIILGNASNKQDWHPEDIKAELKKEDGPCTSLQLLMDTLAVVQCAKYFIARILRQKKLSQMLSIWKLTKYGPQEYCNATSKNPHPQILQIQKIPIPKTPSI